MVTELILVPADLGSIDGAKRCAQYIAKAFASIGMKVREQISLCGSRAELQKAVASSLGRSNVVVVLGGLGKDQDYMSKLVMSQGLRLPLVQDNDCLEAIRAYCRRSGEPFSLEDKALAMVPQNASVFPGQFGKIPGYAISSERQHILLLPDNQTETAAMFSKYVAPYLGGVQAETTVTRTVRTYGILEEQARAKLAELLDTANPAVTLEQDQGEVVVRVSAHAPASQSAAALCTPVLRQIVDRLGDAAYGLDVDSLQSALVAKLASKQLDIAVAEAGTGGIFTRILAETAGGADVLRYAVAVDGDDAKRDKLGVPARLIKKAGSVSERVTVAMADAARAKAGTLVGVAISQGAQKNRRGSPGLVYIAVCDANNVYVKKLVVDTGPSGEQDAVLDAAVSRALNMVRLFVDYLPGSYPAAIPLPEALQGRTLTDKEEYIRDKTPRAQKERGFPGRLAGSFIIQKADETRVKVRKVIFILALLVFLGSAGYVGLYYYESYSSAKQAKELQSMFVIGDMAEDVEVSEDFPRAYLPQFGTLWSLNSDVAGFLSIEDTPLQYPVVQSADDTSNANAYYLRRDFYGKSNQHGIPFLDYRVDFKTPSDNMIIYGHNMKDGQIFGELINYKELDYYRQHPVIDYTTLYEHNRYKIISVFITNAYENQGPVFAYHDFIEAADNDDFLNFVRQVRVRSLIETPVDVKAGDKLLTLSTCTYEFKDARFVVVAREVRDGEDDGVDVQSAKKNPQPLMPDIWYQTFGGTKPLGVESASVVTTPTTNSVSSASSASAVSTMASASGGAVQSSQFAAPSSTGSTGSTGSTSAGGTPSAAPSSGSAAASAGGGSAVSSGGSSASSGSAAPSEPPSSSAAEEASQESSARDSIFDGLDVSSSGGDGGSSRESGESDSGDSGRGPDDLIFDFDAKSSYALQTSSQSPQISIESDKSSASVSGKEPSLFDGLDIDPPPGGAMLTEDDDAIDADADIETDKPSRGSAGNLTVYAGGKKITASAQELVSRVVQNEMGAGFNTEALKAQAVAAYTYIAYHNGKGQVPTVLLSGASAVHTKVSDAVSKVIGEAVYYKNALAFTPYHATSAGQTTSSRAVWGGSYAYLVPVDSAVDKQATYYKVARTFTSDKVAELIYSKLGIDASGDPGDWFEIVSYTDGDYVGDVAVCGETKSQKTGAKITGRILRESVLGLRSASFDIRYNEEQDTFTFTTYGYGHGVGMSQNGANFYAGEGWTYEQILEHYYPGCVVE